MFEDVSSEEAADGDVRLCGDHSDEVGEIDVESFSELMERFVNNKSEPSVNE